MSVTLYVSGRAKRLMSVPELLRRETINGIRRGQQRIRKAAAEGLRLRSIGRTLYGSKVSGAYKNIKRGKVKETTPGLFSADINVNGVAAIQDQGLSIKPHMIRGRGSLKVGVGRVSTIRVGRDLQTFFKGDVVKGYMHPGVRSMPAFPFVNRAFKGNEGAFRTEIQKGVARVAAMVNGG